MFVLTPACTNLREPDTDSVFDLRPETSIVEPDPAGVTFRLSKILLHLKHERCLFGFQEFFIQFLFSAAKLEVKFVNALCASQHGARFIALSAPRGRTRNSSDPRLTHPCEIPTEHQALCQRGNSEGSTNQLPASGSEK